VKGRNLYPFEVGSIFQINSNAYANSSTSVVANGPIHQQQQQQSSQVAFQQNQQLMDPLHQPSIPHISNRAAGPDLDNWDTLSISELVVSKKLQADKYGKNDILQPNIIL
jgi:hypothetical protein